MRIAFIMPLVCVFLAGCNEQLGAPVSTEFGPAPDEDFLELSRGQ
jgi:hypothetical protein